MSTVASVRSLSDFWRYDRSDDQVMELVSVLQGADILIGNMGSDIRVTWSGDEVSYTDLRHRIVALDYGPLRSQDCPFPGTAVDEVIGYAAHEGGHCLWSLPGSDQAIKREIYARWNSLPPALHKDWQADPQAVLAELCRIQNIPEDIYIDHQVALRWPVLAEYIRIARNRLFERTSIDLKAIATANRPDRNAIINLWLSVSLYGYSLPSPISAQVKLAMDSLLDLSQKALGEGNPLARQTMTVQAAIILWREFSNKEAPLPLLSQRKEQGASWQDSKTGGLHKHKSNTASGKIRNLDDFDPCKGPAHNIGREVVPLPKRLLSKVAEAITPEKEDLSQSVSQALAEDPRHVAAGAKRGDYDPELARRVISEVQQQIQQTQQAFRQVRDMNTHWLRGLDRGKLDDHRLWKFAVGDPNCYKRKQVTGIPSLAVGLLLDVSGSMSRYMPIVRHTAAVFYKGLMSMPGINFAAWCYTGQYARVALTRICDRQLPGLCLANVEQGAGTPSGAALAGVKVLMERMPEKRHLLIHFTDGQPDNSTHVLRAIQACRQAGIQVYAIGLSQFQGMLCRQYGEGSYETIEAVPELPHAVAKIVKRLRVPQV